MLFALLENSLNLFFFFKIVLFFIASYPAGPDHGYKSFKVLDGRKKTKRAMCKVWREDLEEFGVSEAAVLTFIKRNIKLTRIWVLLEGLKFWT